MAAVLVMLAMPVSGAASDGLVLAQQEQGQLLGPGDDVVALQPLPQTY